MYPKASLFFVFLLFFVKSSFGNNFLAGHIPFSGCGGISCSSPNGIKISGIIPPPPSDIDTAYISSIDSMDLTLKVIGGCGGLIVFSVKLDGLDINYGVSGSVFNYKVKLLAKPGTYNIFAMSNTGVNSYITFTMIFNPVGVANFLLEGEPVSVFPNPVKNELNILSKTSTIENITIYDSFGQEIEHFRINDFNFKVQTHNYSPGIYFIQVATLSDEIVIKKIVVL